MQTFTTPMMKQYDSIKKQYQDCLLFYRMGDFYELFMDDAYIGAKVLNITLTSRPKGKDGRIPMAGVPFHAVDSYLAKLVKAGYKVAICEQVSLPNKHGIIDREVVRIVTPGTVLDENALNKKDNNHIICLTIDKKVLGMSVADISTGYFASTEVQYEDIEQILQNELSRLNAVECILPENLYNNPQLLKTLKTHQGLNIYCFLDWNTYAENADDYLKKQFGLTTLASFAIDNKPLGKKTAAVLLGYLRHTQRKAVSHIKKITTFTKDDYMLLDKSTIINLELFSTIRDHDIKGSLLSVLDQTVTAMGGRLLKEWLRKPLVKKDEIVNRHDIVGAFLEDITVRNKVRDTLQEIADIERILSRLSVNIGNARDLINLKQSIQTILVIKQTLSKTKSIRIQELGNSIPSKIENVISLVEKYINEEPPIALREGGLIKNNVREELDILRKTVHGSKNWITDLEQQERGKTGIGSLKIRFNSVFGFYIEISKSNLHLVPTNYTRKQTLVNGERFITPELKKHEEIILTSQEKINDLEYQIYQDVLRKILSYTTVLQDAANSIATIDCLLNFAHVAEKNHYVRPKILYSGEIRIKQGRHPVVEKLVEDNRFVPNDGVIDRLNQQLLLITGPNMAGKSVFIRQVALIVLMNQIGSFIPAEKAYLSIVDRIFVRSGASDVITSGLSTFMVEMVETAYILNQATKNSLIVMDEIGRGTSTYDGISIAWAVAEYIVSNNTMSAKTLFATHYHELQTLEQEYPKKIKNFHMAVTDENDEPIFLHTLLPGGASHSFGIAVAKLAGVPDEVIEKAKELVQTLENRSIDHANFYSSKEVEKNDDSQFLFEKLRMNRTKTIAEHLIEKELENLDIHHMTPLEALNKLAELKDKLKLFQKESESIMNAD